MQKPSLRLVFAAGFALLCLVVAAVISMLVGIRAAREIEREVATQFQSMASATANVLEHALADRVRELGMLAATPSMRNPGLPLANRRDMLRQLQQWNALYADLAFVAPDGRILAASGGLGEDTTVAGHDAFENGKLHSFVGEDHAAQPPRSIDASVPVVDAGGRLIGVLTARLHRRWAADAYQVLLEPLLVARPGARLLITDQSGAIVLQSSRDGRALTAVGFASPAAGVSRLRFDGQDQIAGIAGLRGAGSDGRLDWRIVVAEPAAIALLGRDRLEREIVAIGTLIATLAALAGWIAAGWFVEPVRGLGAWLTAAAAGRQAVAPRLRFTELAEIKAVAEQTFDQLRVSRQYLETALCAANAGAWRWDLIADRRTWSPELFALYGALPERGALSTDEWLQLVAADDRSRIEHEMAELLAGRRSEFRVEFRVQHPTLGERWMSSIGRLSRDEAGTPTTLAGITLDISDAKRTEKHQTTIVNELAHRGKNLLAVVQSLAHRSLSGATSLEDGRAKLEGRLLALARTYTTVTDRGFRAITLEHALRTQLAPLRDRVALDGPDIPLPPKVAQTFGLIAHELATNAVQHAAGGSDSLHIVVHWHVDDIGHEPQFTFVWHEHRARADIADAREITSDTFASDTFAGETFVEKRTAAGRPRVRGNRRGFGRELLEIVVGAEFDTTPHWRCDGAGARYEFTCALSSIIAADNDSPQFGEIRACYERARPSAATAAKLN